MRFPSNDDEFAPLLKNMVEYCLKNSKKLGLQTDTIILLQTTYSGWNNKYHRFLSETTDLNRQSKNAARQLLESALRLIVKNLSEEMREI